MQPDKEEWGLFKVPGFEENQIGTKIEGVWFTLFYDYDEIRDGKLWSNSISDKARIEWFKRRMIGILFEPTSRLLDVNSQAFQEINSGWNEGEENIDLPWRTFTASVFFSLLSAIDGLGIFVMEKGARNDKEWIIERTSGRRFKNLIDCLMPVWNRNIVIPRNGLQPDCRDILSRYRGSIKDILWSEFRCGYAHLFRAHGIGYDIFLSKRWEIVNGILEINPILFHQDFRNGFDEFCEEINTNNRKKKFFLNALRQVYPPKKK